MQRQRPGHTLQTTALVNDVYLRLAEQSRPSFTNRSHFCAVAAKAMRQILVNHANAQRRQKRGGGADKVELDEGALISPNQPTALMHLYEVRPRKDKRGVDLISDVLPFALLLVPHPTQARQFLCSGLR
jgi:ECF sigma factor